MACSHAVVVATLWELTLISRGVITPQSPATRRQASRIRPAQSSPFAHCQHHSTRTAPPRRARTSVSAAADRRVAPQPAGLHGSASWCAPCQQRFISYYNHLLLYHVTRRPHHAFGTSSSSFEHCVCPLDADPRKKHALLAAAAWQPPGPRRHVISSLGHLPCQRATAVARPHCPCSHQHPYLAPVSSCTWQQHETSR